MEAQENIMNSIKINRNLISSEVDISGENLLRGENIRVFLPKLKDM